MIDSLFVHSSNEFNDMLGLKLETHSLLCGSFQYHQNACLQSKSCEVVEFIHLFIYFFIYSLIFSFIYLFIVYWPRPNLLDQFKLFNCSLCHKLFDNCLKWMKF